MYKFVRTKSVTGSKFLLNPFSAVVYRMDCSCAPIFRFFSVAPSDATEKNRNIGAQLQSAKFRTAFSGQFRTSLRKDSIPNYASIWTLFTTSVTGPDVLCNALNISQIGL